MDATTAVAAVIVAYRSDPPRLDALLGRLSTQVAMLVVVDNSETHAEREAIAALAARHGASVLGTGINEGVAAAQNRGIRHASAHGAGLIMLFDDDSLPASDYVARLLEGLRRVRAADAKVAAVGPWAYDERDPGSALVFGDTRWGPRRAHRVRGPSVPVAFLLASGCLIDARALADIGPMREDLFIDHIDLEWGLRARAKGWALYALTDVPMAHRLGTDVRRVRWLAGRTVHVHPPLRNYYLVRNTLLLALDRTLPPRWRAGYLAWIVKYVGYNLLAEAPRAQRAAAVLRAIAHALRGRAGRA